MKVIFLIFQIILIILVFNINSEAKKCSKSCNSICLKYYYVEYKSNDINYNHPNALYPVRAIELYPIYNNYKSSNYVLKYKEVCYPYPVYYDLFLYNYPTYYNINSYNTNYYKNYYDYTNNYNNYYESSYYYNSFYDPYQGKPYKIEIKTVSYYDSKTGEFKESTF